MNDWDNFHHTMSGITAEMLGAADYFDQHPEWATDERVAATFRQYVERIRAVEVPS